VFFLIIKISNYEIVQSERANRFVRDYDRVNDDSCSYVGGTLDCDHVILNFVCV